MSAHTAERKLSRAGDAELITLTRRGDADAYAALFRRHASAAAAVARSVTSTFDADDLVSEAYTRVLNALQSGNGPTAAFRPYLFTTVRNVAASWGRVSANTVAVAPEEFDELELPTDDPLASIDRSLTAQAFTSLPARWQEALWYSEVEGMQPARIAPLLGLSAQATAALCYRAREGLRQAWIRAHLTSPDLGPECSWTVDKLGAHARGRLGKRERTRVDAHLDTCAKCALVAAEAKDVGDRLALVLLPLAIGTAGATAYLATLHAGTAGVTAGAVIGGGAAGTTASGAASSSSGTAAGTSVGSAGASGGIFSGTTGIIVGAVTAVVVVGAAVAGIALATAASAHSDTAASTVDSATSSGNSATQNAPDPAPSSVPSPSAAAPKPAPAPAVAAPPAAQAASTQPAAPAAPTAPSPSSPSTPTDPGTPTNPGTPGDPGTPPTTDPQPPAAPAITTVDTGGGRYFPLVSGTAQAGATVKVSGAGSSVTTQAGSDGSWTISTAITGYGVGDGTVSATQTDASTGLESAATTASFTLGAPQASVTSVIRPGGFLVDVTTTGTAGAGYELFLDRTSLGTSTLAGSGSDTRYRLVWPAGQHTVDARYSDGAGRVGPSSQTSFTVKF
ncbi:sigma-70 family RNA polymerase sigma factor [Humibacter sp. RRB41]|uniref:sigma-70 family RNA polymerase sigma factor n=1 Tax=Humibacter sp. RRB41 TaxID=2919946 RepID=UPI001FAA2F5B|nr:sigma-70 family RNA polymerase sigma factor [Humibacter sp. RRB41]